jgi:signal transduction histidine kinase
LDPNLVADTKNRLILILILTNTVILGGSFAAGYFLAGRTLRPIKEMIDEQNRFVADASHELRTPLTSLKTEIEVNLRDKGLVLEDARKLLSSNLEEIDNLQVLSDDLIRLARYESGENGLTIEEVNLFSVTDEAVKKVAKLARNKKITIENEVADCTIFGSKSALTELFVIFLDNAIKYSSPQTTVRLDSEKTNGHILVRVIDQGVGIDQKDIPHIFDRFYRVDESRNKNSAPGYGLGLAIARQIIEKHKGTVRVQSKLNEGTIFTVQLPIKYLHRFV